MKLSSRRVAFSFTVILGTSFAVSGQDYDRNQFRECKEYAQEISGYYGRVPNRHLPGGALEGALKGASTASGLAWLGGANKKERARAAKRGAAIGGLIGALKRGAAKDKQRKAKRQYRRLLDRCMNQRD